ncbi:MAG: DEAD/DEAH box helicase, partial [SAR324 cluster bacterium]|nr:DEAD/DEAH box helicase [SAR324 cluster bacterium]
NEAEIMIATEAGAEGINLQFCSLMINYDLPWNPQRIEQRIGRCHRYGQKYDVVVINFINRKNAADQRVYDLLDEKFSLFKGVFGASDEVLGSIESGVDFEKRIAAIYQKCRSEDEINSAFDELQREMDETIQENLGEAKQKLLENFDAEVHEKLKTNLRESQQYLDTYERWLWDITQHFLGNHADFSENEYLFHLKKNPFADPTVLGPYKIGKNIEDAHIYRPSHPLAQKILQAVKSKELSQAELVFDYTQHGVIISILAPLVGKSGWMIVKNLTVSAFESEDYVYFAGIVDNGEVLDPDQCRRMFALKAQEQSFNQTILSKLHESLIDNLTRRKNEILDTIGNRNNGFFDQELEKLDKWGEDRRNSLKLILKDIDDRIKIIKKEARLAPNLPEKLKLEKERKKLESERDQAWREYDNAAKEIESSKDELIDKIEQRLKQVLTEQTLFLIKWRII